MAVAACACSGSEARVRVNARATPLQAIAVLPVVMHSGDSNFEAAKRTEDILDVLWRHTDWPVMTPRDFMVRKPDSVQFLHATDLVVRSKSIGYDPRRLGVLRLGIAVHEGKGAAIRSGQNDAATQSLYTGAATISLELFDMDGNIQSEASHKVDLDPFAEHPEYDPRSEIRAGVIETVRTFVEACAGCVASAARAPMDLYTNPAVLLLAQNPRGETLAQTIEAADILSKDQILWDSFRYVRPELSLYDAKRLAKTAPGFCVASDEGELLAGDCITAVEGRSIDGPHPLGRVLARRDKVTVTAVGKDGTERTVTVP